MPKQATAALQAYLNANNDVLVADLYTFSLVGGQVLRFVDFPNTTQITIPSPNFPGSPLNFFASGTRTFVVGPKFGRTKVNTKIGIEPSELEITINVALTDLIGSISFVSYVESGGFDGATVELDRFFFPVGHDGIQQPLDTSLGAIVWFYGRVAEVEIGRTQILIKVKSLINILQQQQMPRRLFQSGCTHVFGDAMCGYDRTLGKNALGTSTGIGASNITALTGSTALQIVIAGTPSAVYAQGTVVSTSGSNNGISRGVLNSGAGFVNLTRPFPFPIVNGDTFRMLPGCDHTSNGANGCTARQNILRYGGFDYIPPPELAV